MIKIRYAALEDLAFWRTLDKHLSEDEFIIKINEKRAYVLELDHCLIGLLRYNLFWDNAPFCTMLYIEGNYQRQGYGKKLMERWERDMKAQGYGMLMLSTQVDEQAQHFYRKLGYQDAGAIIFNIPGHEQPMELVMLKGIKD